MERIKVVINADDAKKQISFGAESEDRTINYLKLHFDTVDNNTRTKNSNMVVRIEIKGSYDQANDKEQISMLKKLFDWSKEKTQPSNYRKVDIEIFDESAERPSRSYSFPEMFVLDYYEEYSVVTGEGDNSKSGTKFSLFLNQKQNMLEKNDTEIL